MITEEMLDALRASLPQRMGEARFQHSCGVEKEMRFLASYFMPDRVLEAASAGLLHDITKEMSAKEQVAYCEKYCLATTEHERMVPGLLHAATGAHYARVHYPELATDSVVSAVRKHTTGDREMQTMDVLLYLADYIEENRRYARCIALRNEIHTALLSAEHADLSELLDRFLLAGYQSSLSALLESQSIIALVTIEARNQLLVKKAKQGK